MENKKSNVPKEEDYTIKYIFKEDSNIDINNVIRECFITKLNTEKLKNNDNEILLQLEK